MPTRSGKRYLKPHKCQSCPKESAYYSNEKFDYKCSECWNYCKKNDILGKKEFVKKCNQWVKENTVDEYSRWFILRNKHVSDQHLFNILTSILINSKKYITAEIGLKLYNANPSTNRGHIVCSFIADWWEIKSKNVPANKKWQPYLECYYGNWSEPLEQWSGITTSSIPPKIPLGFKNSFINNEIMMKIRFI